MVSELAGTWVLDSSENFDEFMKELGVNLLLRKAGNVVVPTLIITIDGNNWSVKMRSTFKNHDDDFVIGVEKADETMDGRKVKAIRRIEGNKLVTEQYDQKTNKLQVRGEISVDSDGRMVEQLKCNNVSATRKYKRKV